MTRTSEELIDAWQDGDVNVSEADEITESDGETLQVKFECEDGPVILTYSLSEDLSYKPDPAGNGTAQFNILHG